MQNFIEIHQRNPELLGSGGFRPPRLDRGIERPRLDRVKHPLPFLNFTSITKIENLLFKER